MAEETINLPAPPVAAEPAIQPSQEAPPPRIDRADKLAFTSATLLALLVYLLTLAPEATLEDSGIFATGAYYGGVAFPPGCPVWTLYSWVFTRVLPFSNIAWRIGVGSAIAGALLCGVIAITVSFSAKAILKDAAIIQKLTAQEWDKLRTVSGAVAGLVIGFNGVFWHEAVIVDYWSLSLLLFATVLWLLTGVCFDSSRRGLLCLALLLFGMMTTSSQELLVTLPGLVCLVMFSNIKLGRDLAIFVLPLAAVLNFASGWSPAPWFIINGPWNWPMSVTFAIVIFIGVIVAIPTGGLGSERKSVLPAGIGLIAGLSFYFYLPIASMSTPPVNWGYTRTVDGFFHLLSRGQYEPVNPTGSFARFGQQLWMFLKNTGNDFGWLYLVVALIGVCALCVINHRGRCWLAGLAAIFVCTGPVMLAMLNPSPDRQSLDLTGIYFAASKIILAVLMGIGLIVLGAWVARPGEKR